MSAKRSHKGKKYTELDDVPCCELCEKSSEVYDDDFVLCEAKGIVPRSFLCRKFAYDPLKKRPSPLPDISGLCNINPPNKRF